jgi:hypothetical protein
MIITQCVLTGKSLDENTVIDETVGTFISYEFPPVGKVKIGIPTFLNFINNENLNHPILAGICRNAFENEIEPPTITQDFITTEFKNLSIPKSFKEKWLHFLEIIYSKGGKDYKPLTIVNSRDYPLCYCEDGNEFSRILEYLEENFYIKYQDEKMSFDTTIYRNLLLTDSGIEEVEKDFPKIPMISLVNQAITTGNAEIDQKINHAKEMFFREPQTMDRMRSACETMSFILEPIRQDIKNYISEKDTEDFFNIVNNFDVRHNKDKTINIQHPEQLEWIFYSLLNSINTYTKLKARIG